MLESLVMQGLFLEFFRIDNLLYEWEAFGVFDFLLPFLLVFAIIYAILSQTNVLGDNKGVNMIIAIILGLFAIRFPVVSDFFNVLFANFGIAIAIFIVVIILTGFFVAEKNRKMWIKMVFGFGVVVAIIVVVSAINEFAWFGSYWWQDNWTSILWIAVLLAVIGFFLADKDTSKNWGKLEPVREALGGS